MKPFALILSIALLVGSAQQSQAAVLLSSLTHPTMQTLIALGGDGVIVGSDRFYDFAITGTSPAAPVSANVAVEPITTADGDGLRLPRRMVCDVGRFSDQRNQLPGCRQPLSGSRRCKFILQRHNSLTGHGHLRRGVP